MKSRLLLTIIYLHCGQQTRVDGQAVNVGLWRPNTGKSYKKHLKTPVKRESNEDEGKRCDKSISFLFSL